MSNNTGGPAFPQVDLKNSYGMLVPDRQAGMTLRDYFAAKAMQSLISSSIGNLSKAYADDTDAINPIIAKASYEMADAMLKERAA